jgi:hypothetical protein
VCIVVDRLCGLVVRVPGYRSRGRGSIPGATRFSEKYWFWSGVYSASWVQLRSCGRNSSGFGQDNRDYGRRDVPRWSRNSLYPQSLALTSPTSGGRSVGIVPGLRARRPNKRAVKPTISPDWSFPHLFRKEQHRVHNRWALNLILYQ